MPWTVGADLLGAPLFRVTVGRHPAPADGPDVDDEPAEVRQLGFVGSQIYTPDEEAA